MNGFNTIICSMKRPIPKSFSLEVFGPSNYEDGIDAFSVSHESSRARYIGAADISRTPPESTAAGSNDPAFGHAVKWHFRYLQQ